MFIYLLKNRFEIGHNTHIHYSFRQNKSALKKIGLGYGVLFYEMQTYIAIKTIDRMCSFNLESQNYVFN